MIGIGLPALEILLNENGNAYAGESGFPKRFGWWFWGNGVHAERWHPSGSGGSDWDLSEELATLAPVKDEVTVVSGMKVYMPNAVPHGTGPAGILTGARLGVVGDDFKSSAFGAATLDQIIAKAIGEETRFRSLEMAVEYSETSLSHSAPGQTNPPEVSPAALFERLFGQGFVAPGDDPIIDPKLSLRRSVLDVVGDDATSLKKRLGAADLLRIDQHFENIRALEKQIAKLEEDPPNLAACIKPDEPLPEYPDLDGRRQMKEIHRALAALAAMSLACDQTRVFSMQFSRPVGNVLYQNTSAGHHQLTHDELGDQPQVTHIILQIIEEYAYFVDRLRQIEEGDGTLLDNCAVLGFSDCSFGKSHAIDNYPLMIAGGAGGALKKGIHYKSPAAENASKLSFTLLRAMDVPVTSFGSEEGLVSEGLDDIET
ncbi:DUF1552 domain-containing protein [Endomicrobium sp. AH-315-J14]|nr:DUF1552 domain-containing protein [Endomicrobium sp. AH-315-J14]